MGEAESLESRVSRIEGQINSYDSRFDRVENRLDRIEKRFDHVEQKFDKRFNRFDEKIDDLQVEFQKYTRWLTGYALSGTGIFLLILIKLLFFPA